MGCCTNVAVRAICPYGVVKTWYPLLANLLCLSDSSLFLQQFWPFVETLTKLLKVPSLPSLLLVLLAPPHQMHIYTYLSIYCTVYIYMNVYIHICIWCG